MPLVAAGGVTTGAGLAAVLAAGAGAAAVGTGFLRAAEGGAARPTGPPWPRRAPTAITRAFTGRSARGIVNAFMRRHDPAAPRGYPEVHHLTAPLRAQARAENDADRINLWAGQAHELAREAPAADIVAGLMADARAPRRGRRRPPRLNRAALVPGAPNGADRVPEGGTTSAWFGADRRVRPPRVTRMATRHAPRIVLI